MRGLQQQHDHPSQFTLGLVLGVMVAAVLALPALYYLLVALQEALATGSIRVNPVSRGAPRRWVPWPQAWAHLLGLTLLAAGGLPLFLALISRKSRRPLPPVGRLLAIVAAPVGIPLWLLSGTLVSLRGTYFICGFFVFIALAAFVDRRFGRLFTTLLLLSFVAAVLYFYVGRA